MDMIGTVKKQELRDFILKCYNHCISADIAELDTLFILFDSIHNIIAVRLLNEPLFLDASFDLLQKLFEFENMIKYNSFKKLEVVGYETERFDTISYPRPKLFSIFIEYKEAQVKHKSVGASS